VKAAIHLHQFPKVLPPLSPFSVLLSVSLPAPQSFL